jgi:hypothetical protein
MKLAFAAALVAIAAPAAAEKPRLDMVAFFTGKTHAENVIKIIMERPHKLIVDTVGGKNRNGEFVLLDTIHEEGKPDRERKWVMRAAGPNHFTGSLSDATGPVDINVSGASATIRYTMKGGLKVEQLIELQGDGRTLSNICTVRKFGMKFARIEGTARKLD